MLVPSDSRVRRVGASALKAADTFGDGGDLRARAVAASEFAWIDFRVRTLQSDTLAMNDEEEPKGAVVPDEGSVSGWGCLVVVILCLVFLGLLILVGSLF